jgi:aconitate hydratase
MTAPSDPFQTLTELRSSSGKLLGHYHALPKLESQGVGKISRLPLSVRVVLESVLRNCDGRRIHRESVETLANWNAAEPAQKEIPFVVSRIVLQDFTGVPLLVDLAAMRDAMAVNGKDASKIEPLVPVDLVVDHSVQVDRAGSASAFDANLRFEFERNRERYEFLKWGQQAFETFSVLPPAMGIIHQVNLEYLARLVFDKEQDGMRMLYPDTLVGTDSHTTMINGLGIVGWGVGGIEAEAGMLGQPVYFLTPEVIAVNLSGSLCEGVTATDLTLRITEMLRKEKVVGKFIEFIGEGTARLSLADRATIANMAPEYGATMGYFPVDEQTLEYLRVTGRDADRLELVEAYYRAQGLWGVPSKGSIDYTKVLDLDLSTVHPCVAGPKRPQDRIELPRLATVFRQLLAKPLAEGGFGRELAASNKQIAIEFSTESSYPKRKGGALSLADGSVVIASITSCTNTSNPSVMIAAGLLARNALRRGLQVPDTVKTSLAPGSRVVTDYLERTGLQTSLDQLGFQLVGYGCTTCIGNSGPLDPAIEKAIQEHGLVVASVLSGNRNFEARVHGAVRANFLMSPPLVVAFALAGTVNVDFEKDPIGQDAQGNAVFLKDIWPSDAEVAALVSRGVQPEAFQAQYASIAHANPQWNEVASSEGALYQWNDRSTYIQKPPFFENFSRNVAPIVPLGGMRPLAFFGDSVTTDHISPAGSIQESGPAGRYLVENGVKKVDFNSYGSRRGNDRVMTRGTFANVRIKNALAGGKEGGWTRIFPTGESLSIYDAAQQYRKSNTPLIVIAGHDYGMGSSRDWAAKGTALLGVRAVVARSFERIHRSNLVGMGVLPLQFRDGDSWESLGLNGTEIFDLPEVNESIRPLQTLQLGVHRSDGSKTEVALVLRIDTDIEIEYYRHGGVLPFVLRELMAAD